MPPYVGISWMAFLSLTFAGLSTYGTLFFTLRKSTIIKNVSMTANETGTLYFATFWSIFVSIMCTLIIIILTIFTLDKLGFVMDAVGSGIFNDSQAYKIDYTQIWWSILLYYAIMQALVCFSMSFFIEQLVSTQKNFFIFAFVYILAGIFFSGMISSTMYIHDGKVNIIDLENINKGELDGIMVIDELQWGKPMWIVGQFFPHYGLNQWVWNSLSAGAYHVPEVGERVYNPWNSVNLFDTLNSTKGAYYFWAPIVWSGLLLTASGAMERYQED